MKFIETINVSHPGEDFTSVIDGNPCHAKGGDALLDIIELDDGRRFGRLRGGWKCGLYSFGAGWVFDLTPGARRRDGAPDANHTADIEGRGVESAWLTTEMQELHDVTRAARRAGLWATTREHWFCDVESDWIEAMFLNGASVRELADHWEVRHDAVRFRLRLAGLLPRYDEEIAAWEAGLDASSRGKLDGARRMLDGATGKEKKRLKAALRALERELGRP